MVVEDFCMQSLKKFKKVLVNKIFVVHLQTQTKHGSLGSLAQLVQSVCLTSRGSGVRLPQLPQNSKSGTCSLLQVPFSYVRRPYRNPDDRHSTALSGIRLSSIQTGRGRTAAAQFLHFADTQTETSASESVVEVHLPVVRVTVDKKATTTFTTESRRCRPIDSNEDGNGIKKQTCEIDKLI